jgi:hypothetical protein
MLKTFTCKSVMHIQQALSLANSTCHRIPVTGDRPCKYGNGCALQNNLKKVEENPQVPGRRTVT